MSKGFYRQLAKTNMKKNGKIYTPYILSVIAALAMFYIIQSLPLNPGFENMLGFDTMNSILTFACWVVRIFLVIFMLYTNSFLIKQRRKEFGVYHMLGLEKKHLAITLFWESLSVLVIGLFAGILFGMLLDKLLYADTYARLFGSAGLFCIAACDWTYGGIVCCHNGTKLFL